MTPATDHAIDCATILWDEDGPSGVTELPCNCYLSWEREWAVQYKSTPDREGFDRLFSTIQDRKLSHADALSEVESMNSVGRDRYGVDIAQIMSRLVQPWTPDTVTETE